MPPDLVRPAPFWRTEPRAIAEYRRLRADPIFAGHGVAHGEHQPVLLVPGFLATDRMLAPMLGWLRRTGHAGAGAALGINAACSEDSASRLDRRLDRLVHAYGQRAALIGHSRGGSLARVLAVRRPDLVSGLITIATPPLELAALHLAVRLPARALQMLGAVGVPRVFGGDCMSGACCAGFRADLDRRLPPDMPFIAIGARRDGVVNFRRCLDPAADPVEVDASHLGAVVNVETFRALADALALIRSADRRR